MGRTQEQTSGNQDWRKAAAAKAWLTMRAKREQKMGEIRQDLQQVADDVPVNDLDVVRLYLLNGCKKTSPNYAPGTPVCGWSHYVVISRVGKEITLFHPWSISKFTIPVYSFHPEPADETVTMPKIVAQVQSRMRLSRELNREVPQYVDKIRAALAQKAAN